METVNEKLYHFEETPPQEVWTKISERLSGSRVVPMTQRKKIRLVAFITSSAAVVILVLINFIFLNKPGDRQLAAIPQKVDSNYMEMNNELLETIINAPASEKLSESKNVVSEGFMQYFTVRGPEGEPVKISPKVATLILSADKAYPPRPVWDKKINEWQKIMLTNNIAPTSANLIEIIQQASNTLR